MANFYYYNFGVRVVLCATACNFIFYPASLKAHDFNVNANAINLNEVAFLTRIQTLVDKAKKYTDRLDQEKLLHTAMDIKMEVEAYTGRRIDTDRALSEIENNAKKNGAQFKPGEMKSVKGIIQKGEKKHFLKALYIYDCNFNALDCNETEYQIIAKSDHKDSKDKKDIDVPIRVTIGVTAALAGYFLGFIPHPLTQTASKFLIATGSGLCIDGTINRMEENEKSKNVK